MEVSPYQDNCDCVNVAVVQGTYCLSWVELFEEMKRGWGWWRRTED